MLALAESCQSALNARESALAWAGGVIVATGFAAVVWRVATRRRVWPGSRRLGAATACLLALATVFAGGTGAAGGSVLADVGHSCPSAFDLNIDLGPAGDAIFIGLFVLLCLGPLLVGALVGALGLRVSSGDRLALVLGALVGAATTAITALVVHSHKPEGVDLLPAVALVVFGVAAAATCLAGLRHR